MASAAQDNLAALKQIASALAQPQTNGGVSPSVVFDLVTFNTSSNHILDAAGLDKVCASLEPSSPAMWCQYDGGTALTALETPISSITAAASSSSSSSPDFILLFTDGLDNLGHAKRVPQSIMDCPVPIHVITPTQGADNSRPHNAALLQSIVGRTGGVLERASRIGAGGEAAEMALGRITGRQSPPLITRLEPMVGGKGEGTPEADEVIQEAFLDEAFVTVPDWRLTRTSCVVSASEGGVLITGVYSAAQVAANRYPDGFRIYVQPSTSGGSSPSIDIDIPFNLRNDEAVRLDAPGLARLVALSHCLNAMSESRRLHVDPAFSSHYCEELARRYGLVTEYTSLLFLLTAQQFEDNSIPCPPNHPAHEEWKALHAKAPSAQKVGPRMALVGSSNIVDCICIQFYIQHHYTHHFTHPLPYNDSTMTSHYIYIHVSFCK